jgi:hypothetical protein
MTIDERVTAFMEERGFKEEFPGRFYGIVDGAHRVMNRDACTFMYRLHLEARRDELLNFDPLMHDHNLCIMPTTCVGYQNAESDWQNERNIRIAELDKLIAEVTDGA